jgi:predicted nucleotidyltransferase
MKQISQLIFKFPEKWIHIREIARKLKISPETARKTLSRLKKQGIVEERKQANTLQFRARLENEIYKREKMIFNLHIIYDSGIVNLLSNYYHPKTIVLFGSYARGEDTSTSDIDIGVITNNKKRPNLRIFEKKLSRRIELSLFTRKEVSNEFFTNIINGIVLKGVLKNE